jgi:hypothetical protein
VTGDGDFSPRAFRRGLRGAGAGVTLTEHRVAVELCEYAGQGNPFAWPSIDTLAEDCVLDRRTVIRALNRLAANGFIVCDGTRNGGRGKSTRWRLIAKGVTTDTLSDEERVSPQTERVSPQTVKGVTGDTRSSKEEGGRGGSGAPPPPALTRGGGAPSPSSGSGSGSGEPSNCCQQHHPAGDDDCDDCARAMRKFENWEMYRPQSWAEHSAEYVTNVPAKWLAQGPPRVCDGDHPVGAPCGACKELRLMRVEWEKRRAVWEEDRKDFRRDVRDCKFCDDNGRVHVEGDPELWWCDHGEVDPPLSTFGATSASAPANPNTGSMAAFDSTTVGGNPNDSA